MVMMSLILILFMTQEMTFKMEEFDDFTIMSFGPYKGFELGNIPAIYLLSLYREGGAAGQLKEYIKSCMVPLLEEEQALLN
jgi:uncharacterized protein (DUF3820 family)